MSNYPKKIEGLSINEVEDGYVIYDRKTDKVHYLNNTAAFILELCTGDFSPEEIAQIMQSTYQRNESPIKDVLSVIDKFLSEGIIEGP